MYNPSRTRPRPPTVEQLEARCLPAVTWPGLVNPVAEAPGTAALDKAQPLGTLPAGGQAGVVGTITNATPGAGDVDFYSFQLGATTAVRLETLDRLGGSPLKSVLSLYAVDGGSLSGYSLLAQDDGAARGGDAVIQRTLTAGTYYLAVSGSGDRYFNPLLAGSGYPGDTGAYGLRLAASDPGLAADAGPTVLASDPAAGAALPSSPLLIKLDTSAPVDPATLVPGQTVWLTYNATGNFGTGDQDVPLGFVTADDTPGGVQEIQVSPAAPLAPGYYRLRMAGDPVANPVVVAGLDGTPLGAAHSRNIAGADYTLNFRVTGVSGGAGETSATARDLGDVTAAGTVQVAGTIGDDPNDLVPFDPNAVEFYHFRVSGTGRYGFAAEVFAGRIGSGLDPALTLFRLDPATGKLVLVSADLDSKNQTTADDLSTPLVFDPVVYAGLTAGDYYLAVSSGLNAPDSRLGLGVGTGGVFDPTVPYSGSNGNSTGPYVLNLRVEAEQIPLRVVSTSLPAGGTQTAPLLTFQVRFNEAVNLQQLAALSYAMNGTSCTDAVTLAGPGGTVVSPRLLAYDPATNTATFLLMDPLPDGSYALRLSGAAGLTDLAGAPLQGNEPSGDYVVRFRVATPTRGPWVSQPGNDTPAAAQQIGGLFPHELTAGVTITRAAAAGATDHADYYQLTVPEDGNYTLNLVGVLGLPKLLKIQVLAGGVPVDSFDVSGGQLHLSAGNYVLGVTWVGGSPTGVGYELGIRLVGTGETATTLTSGPAPVLGFRLLGVKPTPVPPPPSDPPPVTPPGPPGPGPGPGPGQTRVPEPPGPFREEPPLPGTPGSNNPAPPAEPSFPAGLLIALGEAPLGGGSASGSVATASGTDTSGPPAVFLAGSPRSLDGTGGEEAEPPAAPGTVVSAVKPTRGGLRLGDVVASLSPVPGMLQAAADLTAALPDPALAADAFFALFGDLPGAGAAAVASLAGPELVFAPAAPAAADAAFGRWPLPTAVGLMAALGAGATLGRLRARRKLVVRPGLPNPVR